MSDNLTLVCDLCLRRFIPRVTGKTVITEKDWVDVCFACLAKLRKEASK